MNNLINSNENDLIIGQDWRAILSLAELLPYFKPKELCELSLVCKYLNSKLKPTKLKIFNLRKYLYYNEIKRLSEPNTSIYPIEDIHFNQLIQVIHNAENFITRVYLETYVVYHLELSVTQSLKNLKFLYLYCVNIPSERLNLIFEQSHSIEELKFSSINVIFSTMAPKSQSQFKFPPRLNRLWMYRCQWVNLDCSGSNSYKVYRHFDTRQLNFTPILNASKEHLPHLKTLICFDDHSVYTIVINHFISANPQLEQCKLNRLIMNPTTLTLLQKCNQLHYLKIDYLDFNPTTFQDFKLTQLQYIKSLKFQNITEETISLIEIFCLNCPNVTEFSIEYDSSYHDSFVRIFTNLKQLRGLILKAKFGSNTFWETNLPTPQLEILELRDFAPLTVDLTKLTSCTQLKRISIVDPFLHFFNTETIERSYKSFSQWKLLRYLESIQFFKI